MKQCGRMNVDGLSLEINDTAERMDTTVHLPSHMLVQAGQNVATGLSLVLDTWSDPSNSEGRSGSTEKLSSLRVVTCQFRSHELCAHMRDDNNLAGAYRQELTRPLVPLHLPSHCDPK